LGKGPARLLVEDNNGDALGLTSLVGGFVVRALPLFWGGFSWKKKLVLETSTSIDGIRGCRFPRIVVITSFNTDSLSCLVRVGWRYFQCFAGYAGSALLCCRFFRMSGLFFN